MLFASNANVLKYFRAVTAIDFYKHFVSVTSFSYSYGFYSGYNT